MSNLYQVLIEVFAIYTQIFAIMNPLGVIPIYVGLTEDIESSERKRLVNHVFLVCTALIIIFTIGGKWILEFFGISVSAIRFGGGILLIAIAIDMLGGLPKTKKVEIDELATVPLATPLLVGPGTIATLLLLITRYPLYEVLIGSIGVVATTHLLFTYSDKVVTYLGKSFIRSLSRVMAIIVAAVASEMMFSAINDWYNKIIIRP